MNAVLALDGFIWKSHQGIEDMDAVIQARDLLREMIVLLGTRLVSMPGSRDECLAPLVEQMLKLREEFRKTRQWKDADAVRECLAGAHIIIEDRPDGPVWRISEA
jgi:cysteinyl-tRNA synthetase